MDETWIDRQEAEEKAQYTKPFDAVTFPQRHWVDNQTVRYKVYSSPKEFTIVEAETASHALLKSGIKKPFKIERYIQNYELEVENDQLKDDIDVYIRPILDTLSEGSGVVSSKLLNSLNEAAEELRQEQGEQPPHQAYSLKEEEDNSSFAENNTTSATPPPPAESTPLGNTEEKPEGGNSLGIQAEESGGDNSIHAGEEEQPITPPSLKKLIDSEEDDGDKPIIE